jgi:DNA-damage-inducible protein J
MTAIIAAVARLTESAFFVNRSEFCADFGGLCYNVAQGDTTMTNSVVRARIDEQVKEEAAAVLATIGLTVSDAFRLMMMRIAKDKALPFEPLIPNAETIEAMKEARRGGLPNYRNIDALLKDLNEDN